MCFSQNKTQASSPMYPQRQKSHSAWCPWFWEAGGDPWRTESAVRAASYRTRVSGNKQRTSCAFGHRKSETDPDRKKSHTMRLTAQCHFCKLKTHLHTKQEGIFYKAACIFRGACPAFRVGPCCAGGGTGCVFKRERGRKRKSDKFTEGPIQKVCVGWGDAAYGLKIGAHSIVKLGKATAMD